jgi:hypothetical protein
VNAIAADASYAPGALTAVVGDRFWALIAVAPDSPVAVQAWRRLRGGASLGGLLQALLADGIGGAPDFVLLAAGDDGRHRLFCRGEVTATVVAAGADGIPTHERVDGAGLLTWREHVVEAAGRIVLGVPPADTALRLPAMSGVLLADCVIVDLAAFVAPEAVPVQQAALVQQAAPVQQTMPMPEVPGTESDEPPRYEWTIPAIPDTITVTPRTVLAAPAPRDDLIDAPPWLAGTGASGESSASGASGATVKRADLPEPAAQAASDVLPDRIGVLVPALVCPEGHVCPPTGAACPRCGAPLPADPVPVLRPALGVLRTSLGDAITLDRGVLMGRNPRVESDAADGPERPHIVKLPGAGGDISRNHLQVTLDGWHVLVTDLGSTNGTLVTPPGRDPQQLRPGEPTLIEPGTLVVLAEGIDFRYEASE